jgi:IMP dehydrogenase
MLKDSFFKKQEALGEALTYGDVSLRLRHSSVKPTEVNTTSRFSRNIELKRPIVSSPMDTVTGPEAAIAMALEGGIGIIPKSNTPKEQASAVSKVRHHLNGLILKPICVQVDETIGKIKKMIGERGFSFRSFPVIDSEKRLVGLLTNNDFAFCRDDGLRVKDVMSPKKDLITRSTNVPIAEVFEIMQTSKKKILPIVNDDGTIFGMYVYSDVQRIISGGSAFYSLDASGSLLVGASIGVGEDALMRAELLAEKGVSVFVIGTAHADSADVFQTLKAVKKLYPRIDVVVGNICEGSAAKSLVKLGADGILVGVGPGSICTTRVVAGVGCPQLTAIHECEKAIRETDVPICADGGIEYSGDIPKAIGAGARSVMLGGLLAGTAEAPGDVITFKGVKYKVYRGMGSEGAMRDLAASKERYGQGGSKAGKLVPEGIEGRVPFSGTIAEVMFQLVGGLRAGMGYLGAATIEDLRWNADFRKVSAAGKKEAHPRIEITSEAPNYKQ